MGHHIAGVLRQDLEQLVFLRREHDPRAIERDEACRQIDRERARLDDRLAG